MRRFPFLALSTLALLASPLYAVVRIQQFVPSLSSPQPVGTTIAWTVAAKDTNPGPLTYRFSVGYRGQTSHVVRDFALPNSFQWTPYLTEGIYTIEVVARDLASGETAPYSVKFTVNPRVVGEHAAVTAIPKPLVAFFISPPWPAAVYIS